MRKIATALLSLGALTAATAVPAHAQEVNPTFTGPRVEGLVGYDTVRSGDSSSSSDESADGLLYGGAVGFDFGVGGAVFGIDAEITGSTGEVTIPFAPTSVLTSRTGRDIYVGARGGALVTPATLVYAKAGYTNARLNASFSNSNAVVTGNYDLDGYRLGAGVEQAVGRNTFAKIEYRYSNYDNATLRDSSGANVGNLGIDTDRHQVVVGFGLRF